MAAILFRTLLYSLLSPLDEDPVSLDIDLFSICSWAGSNVTLSLTD